MKRSSDFSIQTWSAASFHKLTILGGGINAWFWNMFIAYMQGAYLRKSDSWQKLSLLGQKCETKVAKVRMYSDLSVNHASQLF